MNPETQRVIVQAAIQAPSADNSQPWRFKWLTETTLKICTDPARKMASDFGGMYQWFAVGAAAENSILAAGTYGYDGSACVLEADNPIAIVTFGASNSCCGRSDPLAQQIYYRRTTRTMRKADHSTIARLAWKSQGYDPGLGVARHWVFGDGLKRLARVVAACDRLRFRVRIMHADLYRHLVFDEAELLERRDGIDVRTLGLSWWQAIGLRVMRSHKAVRLLQLDRLAGMTAAKAVRESGAVLTLSCPFEKAAESDQLLAAGRAMQRVWLRATQHDLAVQPIGSVPQFMRPGVATLEFGKYRPLLQNCRVWLEDAIPDIAGRQPLVMFRIGLPIGSGLRSRRRDLSDFIDEQRAE